MAREPSNNRDRCPQHVWNEGQLTSKVSWMNSGKTLNPSAAPFSFMANFYFHVSSPSLYSLILGHSASLPIFPHTLKLWQLMDMCSQNTSVIISYPICLKPFGAFTLLLEQRAKIELLTHNGKHCSLLPAIPISCCYTIIPHNFYLLLILFFNNVPNMLHTITHRLECNTEYFYVLFLSVSFYTTYCLLISFSRFAVQNFKIFSPGFWCS